MELIGFKTNEKKYSKVTSYFVKMNNKNILLDFGVEISNNILQNVDAIFLSHEHLDHTFGFISCALSIPDDCRIFSTKTTKKILKGMLEYRLFDVNDRKKVDMVLNRIETYCYDEVFMLDDIECMLYQAGHTFGSSMISLKGEYKLLYTGDMNYYQKVKVLQYDCPNFDYDYVIVDATNIQGFLSKKQTEKTLVKDALTYLKYNDRFLFNARPEKAVLLATLLASDEELEDVQVNYDCDLTWFLNIMISQEYDPFLNNRIKVDKTKTNKGIVISNSKYDYEKNHKIGLHIANAELYGFLCGFQNAKILLGHYDLEAANEITEIADENSFYLIKEGVNIYE